MDDKQLVTMEDILGAKRPLTAPVRICVNSALIHEEERAGEAEKKARVALFGRPDDEELKAALYAAEAAHEEATRRKEAAVVEFVFKALGRDELEALERQHPPTAEQLDEYRAEAKKMGRPSNNPPNYNFDTFPPALLAATNVFPGMTLEQAERLWNDESWSKGELGALFTTAWQLNALTV